MTFLAWVLSWFGGPKAPAPAFIVKAQAETVRLCGFLPAASTVAAIVGAMSGQGAAVATAVSVATTVCKAVSAMKVSTLAGLGKPVTVVNGQLIVIEGEFVK